MEKKVTVYINTSIMLPFATARVNLEGIIPKKGNAKECSNYHTIALISHASKLMLNSPSQASAIREP